MSATPRERPIIMSDVSVRLILSDDKTQTRRVIKPQPEDVLRCAYTARGWSHAHSAETHEGTSPRCLCRDLTPTYGEVGDRLWVREGFYRFTGLHYPEQRFGDVVIPATPRGQIRYRATEPTEGESMQEQSVWAPVSPLFMPRRLSRLTLEITDIRVQRVQAISEADALAEGMRYTPIGTATWSERQSFSIHWDKLNKRRGFSWESNPWVWAVTFRRLP